MCMCACVCVLFSQHLAMPQTCRMVTYSRYAFTVTACWISAAVVPRWCWATSATCQSWIRLVDELGDDMGGLTKDLYTSLQMQILQQYFWGESAVVPHLPLYKHMELRCNFRATGRILAHTVALLKIVPARLSCCFLLCLSLGSAQTSDDLLLSDFRYRKCQKKSAYFHFYSLTEGKYFPEHYWCVC